ncbi:MAG TPA: hypothetical protein VHT73_10890 [Thermodesulfobacteriota bacterium]|nr:hypothetical protein [Thermodesulfobacteriota bacterium]
MNELENPGKSLSLTDFPLPLRKVALVYAQANEYLSFIRACELCGVEPKAAQK